MPHIERELMSPAETASALAPAHIGARRTAALVRAHAANDAICEIETLNDGAAAASAPATAGSGASATTIARRPSSVDLHQRLSRTRSRLIGRAILAGIGAIAGLARRARDAYLARRRAASICTSLDELDDRTLHDLGLDRSEVSSLAAEISGRADATRVHAMLASQGYFR